MKHDKNRATDKAQGITFHNEEAPPVRALIVHTHLRGGPPEEGGTEQRSLAADVEEITGLALAIELDVIDTIIAPVRQVSSATYIGSGKVAEIKKIIKKEDTELVITNTQLSPGQQRNLERAWHCKVLDRTGLILEIFGRRAQTKEGRLQVEWAHLAYQRSRLVRSWTHLERQRGASSTVGGPGETQKESDRRDLQTRMKRIERQLEKVKKTRSLHRKSREKVPYPVVALVGYTNAGKSTLFNQLTTGDVLAEDLLFATLDPTMRQLELPLGRKVILSDTVGFIANLPTQLVAAFRATLEEVLSADLILHVRDIAHDESEAQARDVREVLETLGVERDRLQTMIEVWNKSDLLEEDTLVKRTNLAEKDANIVMMSALAGQGVDTLLETIEASLGDDNNILHIEVSQLRGADIAWVHQNGDVLERVDNAEDNMCYLTARFPENRIGVARQRFTTDIVPPDRQTARNPQAASYTPSRSLGLGP